MVTKRSVHWDVFYKALVKTWEQFSMRSQIHGMRYINDPSGNIYTKALWIGFTLASFIMACTLCQAFWIQFKSSPTRVNVESFHVPVSEVNFPAVTFCDVRRINMKRSRQLAESLILPENVTSDFVTMAIRHTGAFSIKYDADSEEMDLLQEILLNNRYTVETVMNYLSQPCSEMIVKCRFEGVMQDCRKLFKKSSTFRGYCCSFNLRPNLAVNYTSVSTNYFGISQGLSVVLYPETDNLTSLTTYTEGIRLLINEPNVYPSDVSIDKMLPVGFETFTRVLAEQTNTSTGVQDLSATDRNCIFATEKRLKNFNDYRENNCDIECRAEKIIGKCDCLPYFYPNYDGRPICNFTKLRCLNENYEYIFETSDNITIRDGFSCECPSNCNNIYYDVRTNTVPLVAHRFKVDPFYAGLNASHVVVHVYMGSQVYRKLRRDLMTHFVVLFANLGGVFSLFIGMSVISFFEIFFFFTVKMYQNYKIEETESGKVTVFAKRVNDVDVKSIQMKLKLKQ